MIYKAIKKGTIIRSTDGKIDLSNQSNKEYMGMDRERAAERAFSPEPEPPSSKKIEMPSNISGPGGKYSKQDLDKLKTIAQVKQIQVKTDKDRKALISRDLAEKVFSKIYRVMVTQFQQLGPNASPDISAAFGIDDSDKMLAGEEIINKAVFKMLQQVKRIINDFLTNIEAQPIEDE